jgi:hypothetical protein
MPRNDFQKLILSELQFLKTEIKEVRQTDIPNLNTAVGVFKSELKTVKEKVSTKSMIITGVGGLLAVATSMAVAYFK